MKRGLKFLFVSFILIVILGIVSATLTKGDLSHVIDQSYRLGDTLTGWINISLENELSTSIFETSYGDTIMLKTLLNADEDFVSTCNPLSCFSSYEATNEQATKTFTLDAGESAIFAE